MTFLLKNVKIFGYSKKKCMKSLAISNFFCIFVLELKIKSKNYLSYE